MNYTNLSPEKALIWRIVHRDNLPWILDNGLSSGNSTLRSPNWVSIGSSELITKRSTHPVPVSPGGVLNDYVPFYFTPFSVMMRNILSGRGVSRRNKDELLILVSNLHHVTKLGLPFLFTDKHAYYQWANFFSDLADLNKIDWELLQRRDFRRDPDDPVKFERYQAEALIHQHCPIDGLVGIVCYTEPLQRSISQQVQTRGIGLKVHARPNWYF
ncbi:MAG: DUF4433 domain-containing protein [Steroidobacteraceae bacterium]